MIFLRCNKTQELAAAFLLLVLVFINAVKTFHTHNFSYASQIEKSNRSTPALHGNYVCTVCDFQVAKDSDAEVALIIIAVPQQFIESFYAYILPAHTNCSVTSAVRGPPVVA